ncbi:MAG: tetratricopeptide repeat protein [Treponema sp.]|jgi:tetratricopeptide (TPR) repeat protein|nr:tetratricopeptide repeat protein [Treponema sp.]
MSSTLEKVENLGINERLNIFLQRNRKTFIIGFGGLLVLLAGVIAFFLIRDSLEAKAVSAVENFTRRYEALSAELNEPGKAGEVQALQDELSEFAAKHRGYAGARSCSLLANIHAEKKEWAEAEQAWAKAAGLAPKTYLAPVFLFNAAVAAEEQGNIAGAIELYANVVSLKDIFPSAPRAQFSIGRLQETQKNNEAALEAYRAVINNWPGEAVWANLAQNRILVINRQ